MSNEQKALRACADYVRLNAEIRSLTRELGDALAKCPGAWTAAKTTDELLTQTTETHLARVYRGVIEDHPFEPYIRYLSDKEIRARLLDECPHCLAAHHAIQMRKARRASLGATKRFITTLGKKAIKEAA